MRLGTFFSLALSLALGHVSLARASEHPTAGSVEPAQAAEPSEAEPPNDEDDEPVEACGDDEPTVVDDAAMSVDEGRYADARDELVEALQHGTVPAWQHGMALAVLGEAQLELGRARPAARNFRRALEVDAESAGTSARLGLAAALFLEGRRAQADRQARAFLDESCAEWSDPVSCYGANYLRAFTSDDPTVMFESLAAAAKLRRANPELQRSFVQLVALIDRGAHAS